MKPTRHRWMLLAWLNLLACGSHPERATPIAPGPEIVATPRIEVTYRGLSAQVTVREGLLPVPYTTVTWTGERGEFATQTDANGHADVDLTTLPAEAFPYRRPFATLHGYRCPDEVLSLPNETAANLVTARRRLDDVDAWLAIHLGSADVGRMRTLRQDLLREAAARQATLTDLGHKALQAGDFPEARANVLACGELAYGPSGECQDLDQEITRQFVALQVALVADAVAHDLFEAAEAAAWRCRIAAQQDQACLELPPRIVRGRADHALRNGEAALARADFALAEVFAARCLTLVPEQDACQRLTDRTTLAARQSREREVGRALRAAKTAVRKRNWLAARAAFEQCAVLAPEHEACRAGLEHAAQKLGRQVLTAVRRTVVAGKSRQALRTWQPCRGETAAGCAEAQEVLRRAMRGSCVAWCRKSLECERLCLGW